MQATFSNILERIANYIQLTFEDGQTAADSIANLVLEVIPRPRLRAPTAGADAATIAAETFENQIEFKADMDLYALTEEAAAF